MKNFKKQLNTIFENNDPDYKIIKNHKSGKIEIIAKTEPLRGGDWAWGLVGSFNNAEEAKKWFKNNQIEENEYVDETKL